MPNVFDSVIKTPLRLKDPITDDTLPSIGSLSWASMTSDSALSGTTGADSMLVHGNRWQQVYGDLTENYSGSKEIDVKGKHHETIKGDRSITVTAGNMEHTVAAGKLTDRVAQSHEATVGTDYKVQAGRNIEESAGVQHKIQATTVTNTANATATNQAGGVLTIQGSLVKINC